MAKKISKTKSYMNYLDLVKDYGDEQRVGEIQSNETVKLG